MLAVIETHPIQYRGPLYRMLQRDFGVPVTAIYASDFSVRGYRDKDFGASFSWDVDLLSGYDSVFLSRVAEGGAADVDAVTTQGLREALHRVSPRAVLVSGYSPRFHQAGFWHAWRGGWPILFRGEATDMQRGPAGAKQKLRDLALSWMYGRCSRILYIGQSARRHYLAHGCREDKLIFSPYFVNTEPFQAEDSDGRARREVRGRLGIPEDRKVMVFSGKLSEVKCPGLMLDAARKLPVAVRDNLAMIFLGNGVMRQSLERSATELPALQAYFAGFQNQTQVSPYYHAADMLCLPSSWDTWGLVVNEGLYHGLPCLVTDRVGSAADLITPGVTGEVFPHGSADVSVDVSVEGLAAAIERLLPRTGDPATAQACRERAAQYTMEIAAAGIAEAYRAVT
jgi:glycosyltransferase involved in cell wall biosynthesis